MGRIAPANNSSRSHAGWRVLFVQRSVVPITTISGGFEYKITVVAKKRIIDRVCSSYFCDEDATPSLHRGPNDAISIPTETTRTILHLGIRVPRKSESTCFGELYYTDQQAIALGTTIYYPKSSVFRPSILVLVGFACAMVEFSARLG